MLSGCLFQNIVSPGVTSSERGQIEKAAYTGMSMDEAEANVQALGYDCGSRSGSYFDEAGNEHPAASFVTCVKRPGTVSFYCNERTAVTLVPDGDRVRRVVIGKQPSCYKK